MEHRTLQHTLKPQRRLGFTLTRCIRELRCGALNELSKLFGQRVHVDSAGFEHIQGGLVFQKRQQQVFHRHVLVTVGGGIFKRLV